MCFTRMILIYSRCLPSRKKIVAAIEGQLVSMNKTWKQSSDKRFSFDNASKVKSTKWNYKEVELEAVLMCFRRLNEMNRFDFD